MQTYRVTLRDGFMSVDVQAEIIHEDKAYITFEDDDEETVAMFPHAIVVSVLRIASECVES